MSNTPEPIVGIQATGRIARLPSFDEGSGDPRGRVKIEFLSDDKTTHEAVIEPPLSAEWWSITPDMHLSIEGYQKDGTVVIESISLYHPDSPEFDRNEGVEHTDDLPSEQQGGTEDIVEPREEPRAHTKVAGTDSETGE